MRLLSPEPIMCFDCQGLALAQGAVAMLLGKTGFLLSCRPEGCWDGEPTALRLDRFLWRRTMSKKSAPRGCLLRAETALLI